MHKLDQSLVSAGDGQVGGCTYSRARMSSAFSRQKNRAIVALIGHQRYRLFLRRLCRSGGIRRGVGCTYVVICFTRCIYVVCGILGETGENKQQFQM